MTQTIIQIPGPGAAMALAAGISVYSATIVSDAFKPYFLLITVGFIVATLLIEKLHKQGAYFGKTKEDGETMDKKSF